MVASQQTHINELVNKSRSLENSIKKLTDELEKSNTECATLFAERASWEVDRKAWTSDRQKWTEERRVWAEGCDTMQACHRIQQYRMACTLHDERVTILKMQDDVRKEQLKRLQRDYKINMFQAREVELEAQLDELAGLRDAAEVNSSQFETLLSDLNARCTTLDDEVKAKTAEIQTIHKQREQSEVCYSRPGRFMTSLIESRCLKEELRRLRETLADAMASTTSSSTKLARLAVQRDTLQAQVNSLQQSLEVAQDETSQLRSQMENRQNLKKSEDAEADVLRKKNTELEKEISNTRKRMDEMETRVKELESMEARLQKEKGRLEKLKSVLDDWKVLRTTFRAYGPDFLATSR